MAEHRVKQCVGGGRCQRAGLHCGVIIKEADPQAAQAPETQLSCATLVLSLGIGVLCTSGCRCGGCFGARGGPSRAINGAQGYRTPARQGQALQTLADSSGTGAVRGYLLALSLLGTQYILPRAWNGGIQHTWLAHGLVWSVCLALDEASEGLASRPH